MRTAFVKALTETAAEDSRIVFLTGDLGFGMFDSFKNRFPGRYINVGVAESQMVQCATGLALEGMRPVVYSIASFMTGRPFEQIRVCIGYHDLPVLIVGAGGGYCYSESGTTHHAAEDIGLMSLIPGMTVTNPGGPDEVAGLVPELLRLPGPSYLRIGKFGEPNVGGEERVSISAARTVVAGEGIAILTTGDMIHEVKTATGYLRDHNIVPEVVQFHTIRPLDLEMLDSLTSRFDTFVIVEEHLPQGGLYAAINEWKSDTNSQLDLIRLGPPDALALGNLQRQELRKRLRFDATAISETILGLPLSL